MPPYYPDTLPMRTDIARQYNNIITMDRNIGEVLRRLEDAGGHQRRHIDASTIKLGNV